MVTCCNILTPYIPVNGYLPIGCANVNCSAYTPSCFTPTNSSLCGYLQGIDNAICNIQNTFTGTINCDQVNMNNGVDAYPCISATMPENASLCLFADYLNNLFCEIEAQLPSGSGTNGNTGGGGTNTDGSFSSGVITGVTTTGSITLASETVIQHSLTGVLSGAGSAKVTAGANGNATITQGTAQNVVDPVYEVSAWIYLAAPTAGTVTVYSTWNGTGATQQITTFTSAGALTGKWYQIKTWFNPSSSQSVTFSLQINGLTNTDVIYVTDWISTPLTQHESLGVLEPYRFQMFADTFNASRYLGDPFVVSGAGLSSASLAVTIADTQLVAYGKFFFGSSATINATDNTTNYLYYSTVYQGFKITTQSYGDDGDILLWNMVTSGGSVSTTTQVYVSAPISNVYLQPLSVSTGNIQAAAVTDTQLSLTGVSANTYGNATHVPVFAVTSKGRITSVTITPITFPVTSVNGSTGAVLLGLGTLTTAAANKVILGTPSTGDLLTFDGTNWVNSPLSGTNFITGSPATNYMTFFSSAGTITGTNNYQAGTVSGMPAFGIGGSPTQIISSSGSFNGNRLFAITNTYATAANMAVAGMSAINDTGSILDFTISSSQFNPTGVLLADQARVRSTATSGILINTQVSAGINLSTNNTLAATIDTTQRFIMATGAICDSVQKSPATSGTVVSNGAELLELTGASATVALTEPTSPVSGQHWIICTNQASTTISFTNTSNFYNGSLPTTVTYAQGHEFRFDGTKWLQLY